MPEVRCLLLSPEGAIADVRLPDDVRAGALRDAIAQALRMPAGRELVLRRQDGTIIDQGNSLAMSRIGTGARILVEPALGGPGRLGSFRGRGRRNPADDVVVPSGYRVLPCYLVVDTSRSMQGKPIERVNAELPELQLKMLRESLLTEVCQLSLITFDVSARIHMKLTEVSAMTFEPLRAVGAWTSYLSPFELLRTTIAKDLYALYKGGRRPYRPAVFFLSDGMNNGTGDWQGALERLTDRAAFYGAPNIIAFGFGEATEENIRRVGRRAAYMPDDGRPTAKLDTFMAFLLSSLTTSMTRMPQDQDDVLVVPANAPAGWRALRIER